MTFSEENVMKECGCETGKMEALNSLIVGSAKGLLHFDEGRGRGRCRRTGDQTGAVAGFGLAWLAATRMSRNAEIADPPGAVAKARRRSSLPPPSCSPSRKQPTSKTDVCCRGTSDQYREMQENPT